jgi:hypothetical protein
MRYLILLTLFIIGATIHAEISVSNLVSCVCDDGHASQLFTITATGTAGPFTFLWSGPEGYTSTEQNPADMSLAGAYTITVTNAYGCERVLEAEIPACIPLQTLTIEGTNICNEGEMGSVYVSIGAGADVRFTWSNGATTQNLESVAAGTYSVTITDGENCAVVASATVVNAYDPLFGITLENNVGCICNSAPVAAFTLQLLGQNTPYTFAWEGADGFSSAEQNPLITQPGVYTVRVTDAYGCTYEAQTELVSCSGELTTSFDISLACGGTANGEISAQATGTFPPFHYAWSTGASTAQLTGLTAGQYSLTVTDDKGCEDVSLVSVLYTTAITLANDPLVVNCGAASQGSISPEITNGYGPFTYRWSNGATTSSITNLGQGDYGLTITDRYGCEFSFPFRVVNGELPIVSANVTHASCKDPYGAIALMFFPDDDYTIAWSDGVFDLRERTGLEVGIYRVDITDGSGCEMTQTYVVNQSENLPGY